MSCAECSLITIRESIVIFRVTAQGSEGLCDFRYIRRPKASYVDAPVLRYVDTMCDAQSRDVTFHCWWKCEKSALYRNSPQTRATVSQGMPDRLNTARHAFEKTPGWS